MRLELSWILAPLGSQRKRGGPNAWFCDRREPRSLYVKKVPALRCGRCCLMSSKSRTVRTRDWLTWLHKYSFGVRFFIMLAQSSGLARPNKLQMVWVGLLSGRDMTIEPRCGCKIWGLRFKNTARGCLFVSRLAHSQLRHAWLSVWDKLNARPQWDPLNSRTKD